MERPWARRGCRLAFTQARRRRSPSACFRGIARKQTALAALHSAVLPELPTALTAAERRFFLQHLDVFF